MSQSADGDQIYSGFCEQSNVREIDSARGFEHRAALIFFALTNNLDRLLNYLGSHIVEQQNVGSRVESFFDLFERGDLDFDLMQMSRDLARAVDGAGDATHHRQVIVLDQDAVIESQAVVASAADRHGVFFKHSQSGSRLARVHDLRFRSRDGLNVLARHGGDAGKMLKEVQRNALGREQHLGVAEHPGEDFARFDLLAVGHRRFDLDVLIEPAEDQIGDLEPGQNQVLFGQEAAARVLSRTHDRTGCDVAAPDVFVEGAIDDFTCDKQV